MKSIGSIWRKWDLHIHTPASFHWHGKKLHEQNPVERDATCKSICDRITELDIDAFAVMDYWTFDGYLALRDYFASHPAGASKRLFPGIELRLEAPTNHRLNTHVLFDDSILPETLSHFLARLAMGGPEGKPPSRQNFIDVGRGYDAGKLKHHGFAVADKTNEEKMCLLGMQTAVITRESLLKAIDLVGAERCLVIQPYDTSDGLEDLEWKRHPYTDSYLMKMADIFETREPIHVNLFLGHGHPSKATVGAEFIDNLGGYPKPVVSGSDAHRVSDYGVYPNNRITWLKAQPTFSGLRQVCHEPSLRCFIGGSPPKRDHVTQNPTKYMQRLSIDKVPEAVLDEDWFQGISIDLNPGLIAIIGNKGSGKSALADILALAGNTHCSQMEFLTTNRFRRGSDKSRNFKATLTWADGTLSEVKLNQDPDKDNPERVRYLPQQFIENLCNEIASGNETNFERELKKVIFSHVPEEKRLQKASLDELLNYTVESHRKAISQLQSKLRTLNNDILNVEKELSEDTIKAYRTALSLKQTELDAHDKTRPKDVEQPKDDLKNPAAKKTTDALAVAQKQFEEVNTKLAATKTERASLVAKSALLTRLNGHIENFQTSYTTFVEETADEFTEAGFNVAEIVKLVIDHMPVTAELTRTANRLAEIAAILNGSDKQKGLEAIATDTQKAIAKLKGDLAAPQKVYQAFLADLSRWQNRRAEIVGSADKPETIEFLLARIENVEKVLPNRLNELTEQRRQRLRDIHGELLKIRQVYEELYKPVQQIAATSEFAKESLHLQFDAFLAPFKFEDNFLDFIHRHKKGNFYGDDESKQAVHSFVSTCDFNNTDDVVAFLDKVMDALTIVDRGGVTETLTVQSQLKSNKKLADLYDFLFGLTYLEPRYTLKLGDKDISQLSPGEKGALLLVFYLLLDREEIPIIIDQPEQNLDNESVVKLLVDCIRQARARRQVVIVTHNPNLAVVCDADQVICSRINKTAGNSITYETGAIEDYPINKTTVDVLEGTYRAFDNRRKKYHKPRPEFPHTAPVAAGTAAAPAPAPAPSRGIEKLKAVLSDPIPDLNTAFEPEIEFEK